MAKGIEKEAEMDSEEYSGQEDSFRDKVKLQTPSVFEMGSIFLHLNRAVGNYDQSSAA